MPERLLPHAAGQDAARAMMEILARQAAALDLIVYRAAIEGCSNEGPGSHRSTRNALRAQDLCHKTLEVLLALARNFKIPAGRLLATDNRLHDQPVTESTLAACTLLPEASPSFPVPCSPFAAKKSRRAN